jgi:hypothetical protein
MLLTAFNVTMTLGDVNNIFQMRFSGTEETRGEGPVEGQRPFCDKGLKHAGNREGMRE